MARVYKILAEADWQAAQAAGRYDGSPVDRADGFIHLSAGPQVAKTAAKHFCGQPDLLLIAFDAADLGPALRWEPSRDGEDFPHLYGPLNPALAQQAWPLALDRTGRHVLPADL